MASNFFGQIFRITTFGESHGPCVGVVIDGCPAGVEISLQEIEQELSLRKPGRNPYTSARTEEDRVEILSGIFDGKTTGAPIALLIRNQDVDSTPYLAMQDRYRPGHAQFTYLAKYGLFDPRGGSRASARETAARVAAGAIAKKFLSHFQIECAAFIQEVGGIAIKRPDLSDLALLRKKTYASPLFCPDETGGKKMRERLDAIKEEGDSVGGVIACAAKIPKGLGDPIYGKLEALLAFAMLSLPATKGFSMGEGFESAGMKGSEHNDLFEIDETGDVYTPTNRSGGTLGGISTGSPLFFTVAFKPTSTIRKAQKTVSFSKEPAVLEWEDTARHDPCVAIRAVPIIEAMTALVLADVVLMDRCSRIYTERD